MSTYRIYINTTASAVVEVEADSFDEAQRLAVGKAPSVNAGNRFDLDASWEAEDDYYEVDGEVVDHPQRE